MTSGTEQARLGSLDAYRGFVMLAMASGGLGLMTVAARNAELSSFDWLAAQFDHVRWRGCVFWDLIQPSFLFLVGTAMPFSYAARRAAGASWGRLLGHAVWRSLVLIALGVFLSSAWSKQTNFVFTNVLCQIGLGYVFVFLLLNRPPWLQLVACVTILAGYWALFATYPYPEGNTSPLTHGTMPAVDQLRGFAAHWQKNANVAADFDRWFLNLFPREGPFRFNEGGYHTLNFVPSIVTMLFGVLAGEWLRGRHTAGTKVMGLLVAGAVCLAIGTTLDPITTVTRQAPSSRWVVCPIIKRIWTPSWTIYSTAWTCWMLAGFHSLIEVAGWRRWSWPLVVVGRNSIAMYVMAQLMKPWIKGQLQIHVAPLYAWLHDRMGWTWGRDLFGEPFGPIVESLAVLGVLWLICLWLYRRKIFLRI